MSKIPKIINMSYKNIPPKYVFDKWMELNPDYKIDFSLDDDCINFLRNNFNDSFANLFKEIEYGPYKCDFWRLCKLYINGGVYSDIDIEPLMPIDEIIKEDNCDFYSCLALDRSSIFQAIIITKPKNPLILYFISSFINNKPYLKDYLPNGPTYDMYFCLKDILLKENLESNILYEHKLDNIKIRVNIGKSYINRKIYKTFFDIPNNSTIEIEKNRFDDKFEISFKEKFIYVKRIDKLQGWDNDCIINIIIPVENVNYEKYFLFQENLNYGDNIDDAYVSFKGKRIFNSRYKEYYYNKLNGVEWK